jgi:hypothetical protein
MLGRVIFLHSWRDKLPFLVFEIAALLTSRSRRPNSLRMRSAALAIETRSVTSSWSTTRQARFLWLRRRHARSCATQPAQ